LRIILLGPPGAGKGTQAEKLSKKFDIPHISTGDIFREQKEKQTELGKLIAKYIDKGLLVPDDIVIQIIRERLAKADCRKGFILDGFPRTIRQAEALDKILSEIGDAIDIVIFIDVSEEELTRRLLARGRGDDKLCKIKKRFREYKEKTTKLIDYYREKGLLETINGNGSIEEVFNSILNVLKNRGLIQD